MAEPGIDGGRIAAKPATHRIARGLRLVAVLAVMLAGAGIAAAQVPPMAPPPPPYQAAPPPPPGPPGVMVWRPGRWRWNGRAYVWMNGRYVRAPHPYAVWVPGRWVARRRGWVWRPGHWR